MKIITFLSDFGTKNSYVSQMKGAAVGITNARLIDITHEITPHNIREGAYALRSAAPYFPQGTVHVAVVDPGVGTGRRGILITTSKQILIGPDNGILMPTAHFLGDFIVYEISNEKYMLNSISSTFHGRDIFTPVAAHITNGVPFEEIGNRLTDFVDLDFGQGEIRENAATGTVIYVDRFGNIITNLTREILSNVLVYNKNIMVFIGEKCLEMPFVKSYGYVKKRDMLATIGSSNLLEISINQGNAAKKLSVKEDDKLEILFS
ncbi:MAG: S-adenosyl-l-methionine hydroxide adenosyltransferase family protein [Thermoplasmatales archaeon]|nr:MAG: S-adenosyl-l-methionine hydroxide adenosyltransferase family protein [Thermoplasmatales archaeon]